MSDEDKIKSFGDMVDGVERLTAPVYEENKRLHKQLFWERIAFSALIALLVLLAYLTPSEMVQDQDFTQQHQTQSYAEGPGATSR